MKLYIHDRMYYRPGTQPKGATKVDVPTDTNGLVDFLNGYGTGVSTRLTEAHPPMVVELSPFAENLLKPIAMEDAFAALPLATKLHYAALALEEARELTPKLQHASTNHGEDLL